jgi:hypothetical protein
VYVNIGNIYSQSLIYLRIMGQRTSFHISLHSIRHFKELNQISLLKIIGLLD